MCEEAVRERHVSLLTKKQAQNRDKIVRDKAGGEEGGKRENRSGRQAKIDRGKSSHDDFFLRNHTSDVCYMVCGYDSKIH